MLENVSLKELISKIAAWKKQFLYITIVSFVVVSIVTLLMAKQYKSVAVVFPARQFSVSKLVVEANAGNQEDYMMLGDADDCEKLIQLLTSDQLKMMAADRFDLWHRWKIKDTVFAYHYLKLKWEDQVAIKRTEFNSIRVEVHDYTANDAANLANGIVALCDTLKFEMNRKVAGPVVKIVKAEYENTLKRMKELEDSLDVLRSMGIMHYKEQVKAYARQYAKALDKNDVGAMRRLQTKIDTLQKFGGAYQYVHDNLEKYSAKYPDIKMKYDEALVNYNNTMSIKFEVQKAYPDEYKAKPKRMIIVGVSVLACNILGLFVLLARERFRKQS